MTFLSLVAFQLGGAGPPTWLRLWTASYFNILQNSFNWTLHVLSAGAMKCEDGPRHLAPRFRLIAASVMLRNNNNDNKLIFLPNNTSAFMRKIHVQAIMFFSDLSGQPVHLDVGRCSVECESLPATETPYVSVLERIKGRQVLSTSIHLNAFCVSIEQGFSTEDDWPPLWATRH